VTGAATMTRDSQIKLLIAMFSFLPHWVVKERSSLHFGGCLGSFGHEAHEFIAIHFCLFIIYKLCLSLILN